MTIVEWLIVGGVIGFIIVVAASRPRSKTEEDEQEQDMQIRNVVVRNRKSVNSENAHKILQRVSRIRRTNTRQFASDINDVLDEFFEILDIIDEMAYRAEMLAMITDYVTTLDADFGNQYSEYMGQNEGQADNQVIDNLVEKEPEPEVQAEISGNEDLSDIQTARS